ncbi:MAG: hypothetical protein JST50_22720, partial [Bacteroidetes bacterium]|nr:hypothetical protein [Bacteroidota bacterium]
MSATYNWAYKPGVTNKYNIIINSSADDVRPGGMAYVAPFGNDITGNGSRQYPYRTIEGATNKVSGGSLTVILAAGVYREIPCTTTLPQNSTVRGIIGDGDVILDAAYVNTNKPYANAIELSAYNITWRNFSDAADVAKFPAFDVIYENCQSLSQYNDAGYNYINNCIYNNIGRAEASNGSTNIMGGINTLSNCTYNNIGWLLFTNPPQKYAVTNNIYVNCNISFDHYTELDYSLFYNCKFYFGTATPVFTAINDVASLQAAMAAAFSVPADAANFSHCIFADPKFNNASIGDFTLATDSPAKNASPQGTYIGAAPVGSTLKISATESSGNLDFSSAVNLTINDNSLTITDTTQNSQVDTKLIANPTGRELSKLSVSGITAD